MAEKKATQYSVLLKFTSARQLETFLNSHLPFSCEIEAHGEVKPIRRRGKATKKTPAARPQIPSI